MTSHAKADLRPDIQAMRAIAVLAVFGYHLWPSVFRGGFVGVDVFFVISGFLITGLLLREAEGTGHIQARAFWSRRLRRLLPASLTVLAVTAVATYVWVPANLWSQFLRETIASALYVENWVLAGDSVDYLAAGNTPSPVQNFWTLSVEEQFYIFTPLLLIALLIVARRFGTRRHLLVGGIATITAASFVFSVWLTAVDAPAAYFVTTTRAWEFCAGALLLFIPAVWSIRAGRFAVGLGLVGVIGAVFLLSARLPFPGALAAWPVLAAALMIWGGRATGPSWQRVAAWRPVQFVGDVSYSTYLWHWPLIVILPYSLGHNLHAIDKLAIVVATFALAATSKRFIEDPIRYSPRLLGGQRSMRAIGTWAVAGMAAVVAVSAMGIAAVDAGRDRSAAQTARYVADAPGCLGAMAIVNASSCVGMVPDDVLVPDPAHAGTDAVALSGCWTRLDDAELHVCSLGPKDAAVRLAAIGDSHSNALLVAYQALAERNGWRIDVAGHNGCYWTMAVHAKPTQSMIDACEGWKANVNAWLSGGAPYDAILVTNARARSKPIVAAGQDVTDVAVQGLVDEWATQTARGTRIIAIRDNASMKADVVSCVVRYRLQAITKCDVPARRALGTRDALVEAAARTDGARVVDLTDIYCPAGACLPVIGHVVVFQDRDHMTATFVRSLVPVLSERIAAALP